MVTTSLDIKNSLLIHRYKIINILDYNSEKISIIKNSNKIHVYYNHNPFFLSIDGRKGYFEQHNDESNMIFGSKKTKYLTIIFMSEHQKVNVYENIRKN